MPGFLKRNQTLLINADRLGKRYGRRPSELITGASADWRLDLACYEAGVKQENREAKAAQRKQRRR